MDEMRKNGEGYLDPTAYAAFKNMAKDRGYLAKKLAYAIYSVAHLAGFNVLNVTLIDNTTGEIYKK